MQSSQTTSRIRRTAKGCGVLAVASLIILLLGLIYLLLPSRPPAQQRQRPTSPPAHSSADRQRVISAARILVGDGKRTSTPTQEVAKQEPTDSGFIETAAGQCWWESIWVTPDKHSLLFTCQGWESSQWETTLVTVAGNSLREWTLVDPQGNERTVSFSTAPDEWRLWTGRTVEWLEQIYINRHDRRLVERVFLYSSQRALESDILFTACWYADATGRKLGETIDEVDNTLQEWGLTEPDP